MHRVTAAAVPGAEWLLEKPFSLPAERTLLLFPDGPIPFDYENCGSEK